MKWKFVTPKAAHHNGVTESLVKTTKRYLRISLGEALLYPLELQMVLHEITQMINQRPIGKQNPDPDDSFNYLCPNDLLLGRAIPDVRLRTVRSLNRAV
jgi:hypothetical protein